MGGQQSKSSSSHNNKKVEEIEMKEMKKESPPKRSPSNEPEADFTKESESNFDVASIFIQKYYEAKGSPLSPKEVEILKDMKPIDGTEATNFMQKFQGADGLAQKHLIAQGNTISMWEKKATSAYLRARENLNKITLTETSLEAIQEQEETRIAFYQRFSIYNKSVKPDQGSFEVKVNLSDINEPLEIKAALQLVKGKKQKFEDLVEVEALFYRAIHELMKINKDNISQIQNYRPPKTTT